MQLFVFDTETTGFVERDGPLEIQPHIIQFSGILLEMNTGADLVEIDRIDEYIRPPISIPFGSSQVHGIYDADVAEKPTLSERIDTFLKYLNGADIVIGHNLEYDEQVIRFELERMHRKGDYSPKNTLCTMKTTVDFCALPGRGVNYRFPKLNELYKKLFGEFFEGAHSAIYDVEATVRIIRELIRLQVIELRSNTVLRLF